LKPMELRHLEHFIAIAEESSFTQAAKRQHLSQSALSISIRALERDLGTRLFERTSHDVALSDAGRALLPEVRQILNCIDVARKAVGDVGTGLRGAFRLGLMQALPLVDLAEILARYHKERPLVEIRPRPAPGGSAALAEDVRKGNLDAAIVCLPGGAPDGLVLTPLAAEPIRLVCRPDHPLATHTSVAINELGNERFMSWSGMPTRERSASDCCEISAGLGGGPSPPTVTSHSVMSPTTFSNSSVSMVPGCRSSQIFGRSDARRQTRSGSRATGRSRGRAHATLRRHPPGTRMRRPRRDRRLERWSRRTAGTGCCWSVLRRS